MRTMIAGICRGMPRKPGTWVSTKYVLSTAMQSHDHTVLAFCGESPLHIFTVSRIDDGVAVRVSALLSLSGLGAGVLKVIVTDLSWCLDTGFGCSNLP